MKAFAGEAPTPTAESVTFTKDMLIVELSDGEASQWHSTGSRP